MKSIYKTNQLSTLALGILFFSISHASSPFIPVPPNIIAKQKFKAAKDNLLIILDDSKGMNKTVRPANMTRFETALLGLNNTLNANIDYRDPYKYLDIYSDFNVGLSPFSRTAVGNRYTTVLPIIDLEQFLKTIPKDAKEYKEAMAALGNDLIYKGNIKIQNGIMPLTFSPVSKWTLDTKSSKGNVYDNLNSYFYPTVVGNSMKYRCANNHVIIITNAIPADYKNTINSTRYITPKLAASMDRWASVHTGNFWDALLNPGTNKLDQDTPPGTFNENGWPKQTIHTHYVLMNDGGDKDPILEWGKISAKESQGYVQYVPGTRWEDVANAIQSILREIKREPLPSLAVNPGFSHVTTGQLNSLGFQVYTNTDIWASQVRAVVLKPDGTEDKYGGRTNSLVQAYPWSETPEKGYSIVIQTPQHGVQPLNSGDLGKNLSNVSFDLSNTDTNEWKEKFIPWLAFWQKEGDKGSPYRVRGEKANDYDRFIGDMLSGNILFSGPVHDFKYKLLLDSENDVSTKLNEFMFLSSNDGMTKIYQNQNATGQNPYTFIFGYISGAAKRENGRSLIQDIKDRANPDYTKDDMYPHIYLSNGDTRQLTSPRGQNIIVTTLGQAGRGAFALNVGGNTDWDSTKKVGINAAQNSIQLKDTVPLWDTAAPIKGGSGVGVIGTENIGYTIGAPAIDLIALTRTEEKQAITSGENSDVRMAAFISNGPESAEQTPTLYIIDTIGAKMHKKGSIENNTQGQLIAALNVPALNLSNSALSTPTPVDLDGDDIADLVYAGDRNGNMYRFDLRGQSPKDWKVQLLFKGDTNQPISTAPSIHIKQKGSKLFVVFGTGSDIYNKDTTDVSQQALYGVIDDVTKDIAIPTTVSDLLEQELSISGDLKYRTVSSNPINSEHKGWFIKLNQTGEKIVRDIEVRNGTVYANTAIFKPAKKNETVAETKCDASTANANSWLLMVKAESGGLVDKKASGIKDKNGEYIAGISFESIMLGSPNFLSPSLNLITGQGFAHNENGIRTKTGQSQFGQDKVEQEKGCVKGKTYIYIPDPDNPSNRIAKEIICAANKGLTRRISWRIL
ncbi:pilus assembly protein [Neisseria sp. Ec49-e6-T10]|uniref:pilus assembly protein n=1 Tax=Neisseria sp. Ec49-e6-T10 TaxID=3140744 RepID=UPI003EB8E3EE